VLAAPIVPALKPSESTATTAASGSATFRAKARTFLAWPSGRPVFIDATNDLGENPFRL
jgi:hypothetical protein